MTRAETRSHSVVADAPKLLEALAVPFGTYYGVATCRPVPGARTLTDVLPDLLCALGKTEVLARPGRPSLELTQLWMRAHELARLFVTGADALPVGVWAELCQLGDQVGCDMVFVSAEPPRWLAQLPGSLHLGGPTHLESHPDWRQVQPPVGAALPDAEFPALPAACAQLLEADHATRAQAIYDDALAAAFDALPSNRLLTWADAEHAFRCALARTPDLDAVPLAIHAVRAAGLLRGYHLGFRRDCGVAFDDLLTADRLAQLRRLVLPDQAVAGVLAGMPGTSWAFSVHGDGAWVHLDDTAHLVPVQARPLMRAWDKTEASSHRSRWAVAPPRPSDGRQRCLWRTPPPEALTVECEMIDCRAFRRIGDPPMDWTRPPRARRRR